MALDITGGLGLVLRPKELRPKFVRGSKTVLPGLLFSLNWSWGSTELVQAMWFVVGMSGGGGSEEVRNREDLPQAFFGEVTG